MIRILYRDADAKITMYPSPEQLPELLQKTDGAVWIDLLGPTNDEYRLILERTFHFHPLAVEDAINESHLPKLDDFGAYLYLVFHTVSSGDEPMDIDTEEVDVFLGQNYLVTMHEKPRQSIERCWNEEYHVLRGLKRGPAMLLYELLDSQIDNYMPLIDKFEEQIERLGDEIFTAMEKNEKELLNRLLTAKSSALRLERILSPQREMFGKLAAVKYQVIPESAQIYFRDAYDHLSRLADLAASMRDLAGSTIDTHLALVNNRMNEIMKVLTMMSTIFIPLSFIAAVYGMNFNSMPEMQSKWSYPAIWVVFIVVAVSMLVFFRRRRWI